MNPSSSMTLEDWASQWAPKIWSLLHRAAGARQALSDEFLEIVTESRSTLVRALKAGEALETNYLFIERWLKRYGRIRWDLGRWAHYSQLPLLDRLLWSAVFSENWNRQDVLLSFRLTPAALSFRLFRIWTRLSGLAPDRLLATDRMCVRHDLYFIDHHMGWEVSDPAGVLDRLQLQEHRRHCSRCQTLAHELQETMKKFQELDSKVPAYPLEEFRQAWHVPHPLKPRHWPWWVQVPVQVSLVVAAVMGVLSVPYVGELWPLVSRWATPTAERMAETGLEKPETQRNPPSPVVDEAKTSISEVATLTNPVEKSVERAETLGTPPQALQMPNPVTVAKRPSAYVEFVPPYFDPSIPNSTVVAAAPQLIPKVLPQAPSQVLVAEQEQAATTPKLQASAAPPLSKTPLLNTPPPVAPVPVVATRVETAPVAAESSVRPELVFFRWGAFASDLDQVTPKIVELLGRYGAERAGELELGAQYRGGRYFHFSLPESAFDSLANEVRGLQITEFTNTRAISTDRRTPPGKKRVVFLIRPNP